jgi:MerR family transcriptional regulator, light-induced transcriptional regulator
MESLPQQQTAWGGEAGHVPPECGAEGQDTRPDEAANDVRMSQLARTIEQEIIPRLMLAHRTLSVPAAVPTAQPGGVDPVYPAIKPDDVLHFVKLVLSHDEDAALAHIRHLRAGPLSIESIYLDLLAPTSRYLGHLWDEDLCSFTDVTVGLGRLQRVLRELSPALGRTVEHPAHGRRVLLLPSPGEHHTFGLVMVAEFFRSAGWDVTGGAWLSGADASAMVAAEWFDVMGYSVGAAVHVPALTDSISAVRRASCNPALKILVGGPLFGVHPGFVDQVGADGVTIDGREAPLLAETLMAGNESKHGPPG